MLVLLIPPPVNHLGEVGIIRRALEGADIRKGFDGSRLGSSRR